MRITNRGIQRIAVVLTFAGGAALATPRSAAAFDDYRDCTQCEYEQAKVDANAACYNNGGWYSGGHWEPLDCGFVTGCAYNLTTPQVEMDFFCVEEPEPVNQCEGSQFCQ